MEPSKNIVRGMLAFEELLTAYPEWRGRVVHVALAYPSRQGLAEYLAYASDVEHTAARINHSLGSDDWTPILLSVQDDWPRSLAALTLSDVLLVNPVRDGLNLVAKEGPLLNTADGVLVLSHQAGAWEELSLDGGGALGVNPFDVAGTADALHAALTMDAAERATRAGALRDAVRGRTAADWWADQLAAAARCRRDGLRWRRPRRGATPLLPLRRAPRDRRRRPRRPGSRCPRRPRTPQHAAGRPGRAAHASAAKAGRSPTSSPKAAAATGGSAPRVVLRHEGTHHRPLVHVERRAQLALVASLHHHEATGDVLARHEGQHPVLVLGRPAPVQRHGQALGLDVDAGGRRGLRLGHHLVDHGGPGLVRRPRRARSSP